MKPTQWLIAWIVAMTLTAHSADTWRLPEARLPLLTKAPVIDGKIEAGEWAGAIRLERFCGVRSPLLTGGEASFYVACDGQKLYLALESETAPGGQLLTRVEPAPEGGNARVWLDDSIELVLDPLRDASLERRRMYHAIINARGAIYDQRHIVKGGGEAWRGHWEIGNQIIGDRWHLELAIPLADMDVKPEDLTHAFGVRVCRNWQRTTGPKQSEWAAEGSSFLSDETMPLIHWDAQAPVVQTLQLHDPGGDTPHLIVSIANPHDVPMTVRAQLRLSPKSSAKVNVDRTLTIQPGKSEVVELVSGMATGDQAATTIDIGSPDGARTYYRRDFLLQMGRNEPFFLVNEGDDMRTGFDFAYFPSHNRIQAKVDLSGLKSKESVTGLRLDIRPQGGKPIVGWDLPLQEFGTSTEQAVPDLAEGTYEAVLTLLGTELPPVVTPFVRHHFEWEGNSLGKSDILIPPYTAIEVEGDQVSTILRRHFVGAAGLWEQVEALDKPLLASPMRLDIAAAGQQHQATSEPQKTTLQSPTRVDTEGAWQAGPLTGTVNTRWDFDGAMQWQTTLQPSDQPIEAITLTIPLDNALMPLMHTCTDGIRFNYAGAVPPGDGVIWESTQASRNSIIGSYVPYIWLGAEERGLCVYGENDAGWITSSTVPTQQLIRRGDALELVMHLVVGPVTISEPRTITLTFQATPLKPMPDDWRLQVFAGWRGASIPGVKYIAFLGSCYYWGGPTPCLDWCPRDGDMGYLRKLAETRQTGLVDEAYKTEWLKGYQRALDTAPTPERRKAMETVYFNHVRSAFHTMTSKPEWVNIYTNGRGIRFDLPAGQTFLDEWHREAFSKRDWPYMGGVAYDLDPVESFRDYAIWNFHQMAEILVDSFYWDDLFMQSNFDTVGTSAYRHPSGQVQPSMGLHNMREFVRRTARMQLEMGKPAMNIVHMTNTAISPVLAFAQMNYTWEDHSGSSDFQDRYSREYTRAESIGRQQGNVPYALWLVNSGTPEQLAWVERTGTGAMLVHEIKTSGGGDVWWQTYRSMVEYGYGRPEVAVSQYWREEHPASIAGSDAVSLVMNKPGSALVLICDYGEGGDLTLELDRQALKLGGTLTALDQETGQPLQVDSEGKIHFPLKKHDFKLVLVTATP